MLQQGRDNPIAQRVCEFFESQLAWHRLVLDDLDGFGACVSTDDLAELEERRSCYGRDIAEQEAKLRGLLAEWRGSPKQGKDEAAKVRALAARAEEMAARVASELQRASVLAGARAEEVRRNLESLREGRQIFCAYRQAQTDDPGFIDESV